MTPDVLLVPHLEIYLFSLAVLFVLLFRLLADRDRHFLQYRVFLGMVLGAMASLVVEAASWYFEGKPGELARVGNIVANEILYAINLVPLLFWAFYVDFFVTREARQFKTTAVVVAVLYAVNLSLVVASLWTGVYFSVDAQNHYHRGSLYALAACLYFGLLVWAMVKIFLGRRNIDRRFLPALLLFSLPPAIAVVLQILFYGTALIWAGVTVSLLIVYTSVQDRVLSTDYLTGLYNRRQLDSYLGHRVRTLAPNRILGAMMIDIDHFKQINDTHGHLVGDRAIATTAALLRKTFHHGDFIARYAGDEFVVLFDVQNEQDLERVKVRLLDQFRAFNQSQKEPFELSISIGLVSYTRQETATSDKLLQRIDEAMYSQKKLRTSGSGHSLRSR